MFSLSISCLTTSNLPSSRTTWLNFVLHFLCLEWWFFFFQLTKSCPTLWGPMDCSLLCPWNSPGTNTGVGCHFLLQGTFPTQGLNPRLLCWQADSLPLSHRGSYFIRIKVRQHWFLKSLWKPLTNTSLSMAWGFYCTSVTTSVSTCVNVKYQFGKDFESKKRFLDRLHSAKVRQTVIPTRSTSLYPWLITYMHSYVTSESFTKTQKKRHRKK